jgi:hypothetical protein
MDASTTFSRIFANYNLSESSGIGNLSLSGRHLRGLVDNRLVRFGRAPAWGPMYDRGGDLQEVRSQHNLHSYVVYQHVKQKTRWSIYHISDAVVAPDCSITSGATMMDISENQ